MVGRNFFSTTKAFYRFVKAYSKEFGDQGYGPEEMIDFVLNNAVLSNVDQPLHGMLGLIAWYRARADFLEKQLNSHEVPEVKSG